jgi:hypothetical protein
MAAMNIVFQADASIHIFDNTETSAPLGMILNDAIEQVHRFFFLCRINIRSKGGSIYPCVYVLINHGRLFFFKLPYQISIPNSRNIAASLSFSRRSASAL